MFLSKSFGYALRGVLYVAVMEPKRKKVKIEQIAKKLAVPRHFLAKIMKKMVQEDILTSTKGPYGGFSLSDSTMQTNLLHLVKITDGMEQFKTCGLGLRKCNSKKPCPLHFQMLQIRDGILSEFSQTTISDLLNKQNPDFVKSISAL